MEEATFLTKFASKVTLVHRNDKFRASPIMLKRAQENPKIAFKTPLPGWWTCWARTKVTGVMLENRPSDCKAKEEFKAEAVSFPGHRPQAQCRGSFAELDKDEVGYLIANPRTQVGVKGQVLPGVFAAGDVADHQYRQAITAAGTGCAAALEASRFLEANEHA